MNGIVDRLTGGSRLARPSYRYERVRLGLQVLSSSPGSKLADALLSEGLDAEAQEVMLVIALDNADKVQAVAEVARGDYHKVTVPITALLTVPMLAGTTRLAIAHNHPSGALRPSKHDLELTRVIAVAANALGMTLADHIIAVPSGRLYSLRDAGILEVPAPIDNEVES